MNLNNVKLVLKNLQKHIDGDRNLFNTSWLKEAREELVDVLKLDAELNREFGVCKQKFDEITAQKTYLDYTFKMFLAEFAASSASLNNIAISEEGAIEASVSQMIGKISEMQSEMNFLELCQSLTV